MAQKRPHRATLQNLEDAGCCCELVRRYCRLEAQPKQKPLIRKEQIRLLYGWRKTLLEQIHECQTKLDCLDHLLFTLKQQEKESEE